MLSSGTTCAKGMVVRMTTELTTLAPSKMEIKPTALNTQPDFRCFFKPDAQHMLVPSSLVVWFVCQCPMFFEGPDAQRMLGPSSMSVVLFA